MGTRSATINLATASPKAFTGNIPASGKFSIQMLSADLSATTTFNLQGSLDGTNWDTIMSNDTDITDTLVLNETKLRSFELEPSIKKWRILFSGTTTGTVSYTVNSL